MGPQQASRLKGKNTSQYEIITHEIIPIVAFGICTGGIHPYMTMKLFSSPGAAVPSYLFLILMMIRVSHLLRQYYDMLK